MSEDVSTIGCRSIRWHSSSMHCSIQARLLDSLAFNQASTNEDNHLTSENTFSVNGSLVHVVYIPCQLEGIWRTSVSARFVNSISVHTRLFTFVCDAVERLGRRSWRTVLVGQGWYFPSIDVF